jgi:hypothetical protein
MPRIPKEYEMTIRGHIRRLLIMDPSMTLVEIEKYLYKLGIKIGVDYISTQRKKIAREKLQKGMSHVLTVHLQNFLDTMSEADRHLWSMASDKSQPPGVRIYAISQIRENQKEVFDKLFEAGVFEKQLGKLKISTFMDIVRDAITLENERVVETTSRSHPALPQESGGVHPDVLGQGFADMVRAQGDLGSDPAAPQGGGT